MKINSSYVQSAQIAISATYGDYSVSSLITYGTTNGVFSPEPSITGGSVAYNGNTVATFTATTTSNPAFYYSVASREQRTEIHNVVEQFLIDARNFISHCEVTVQSHINNPNEEEE